MDGTQATTLIELKALAYDAIGELEIAQQQARDIVDGPQRKLQQINAQIAKLERSKP